VTRIERKASKVVGVIDTVLTSYWKESDHSDDGEMSSFVVSEVGFRAPSSSVV
jgi:hypothetical protein